MASPLLDRRSPAELAESGQVFELKGQIDDFDRLQEAVESLLSGLPEAEKPDGWKQRPVEIRIRFGWWEATAGVPALTGRVSAVVPLVCQRCLAPYDTELAAELRLLIAEPGQAIADPGSWEVWEWDEQSDRPLDMVDETLVMAIPFAPMHPDDAGCAAKENEPAGEKQDLVRPFADLRALMADQEQKE